MQKIIGMFSVVFWVALVGLLPTAAQSAEDIEFVCADGTPIYNGIQVVVNMRTGFSYTATALGTEGFDPVLAVVEENGDLMCNDDNVNAANYELSLPTISGRSGRLDSQVRFTYTGSQAFGDVSLVVGGFADSVGSFAVILEGMYVTAEDGPGDPISIRLNRKMTGDNAQVTVYMVALNRLDPLMRLVDFRQNPALTLIDENNLAVECDDAGNANLCWGESYDLNGGYITSPIAGGRVPTITTDSMMIVPVDELLSFDFEWADFLMTSYNRNTTGEYIVVIHFIIDEAPPLDVEGDAFTDRGAADGVAAR